MKILNLYAGIGGNRKLWGDWKKTHIHTHSIGDNHWIGQGSRRDCSECNTRWGELPPSSEKLPKEEKNG